MPGPIDHVERRRQIVEETRRLIAEKGISAVRFRTIASRLGGSTSLVTHYFSSRSDLLAAIAADAVESWHADLQQIEEEHPDPLARLQTILLDWMLPVEGEDLVNEQVRINLIAADVQGVLDTHEPLDILELGVKAELRSALSELVPSVDVEHYVDIICVVYNGIVLSALEQPELWTDERQVAVLSTVFDLLPLAQHARKT